MNKENIIRMAREAGSIDSEDVIETVYEAFTAAEREACAKVCEEAADLFGNSGHIGVCITNAGAIRARGNQ